MSSATMNQSLLSRIHFLFALLVATWIVTPMSAGASPPEPAPFGAPIAWTGAPAVEAGDYFKALNSRAELRFGEQIAISANLMLVGTTSEDGAARGIDGDPSDQTAERSGAVYVFERKAGSWQVGSYLKASNADAGDAFGVSIAMSGNTAVIGAVLESSSARGVNGDQSNNDLHESGAAYVFTQEPDGWMQQAYLKASNSDVRDIFGSAVAIDGNLLVVGAPYEDSAATGIGGDQSDNSMNNAGAVYVFLRSAGTWTQIAYVKAPNTGEAFGFGACLAISGNRFVVGSQTEDSNATGVDGDPYNNLANQSGAAYVYRIDGQTVTLEAYLKASNTEVDDRFGCGLDIDGDTIAVGAALEDSAARNVGGDQSDNSMSMAGAVYIFHRTAANGWQQQAYIKAINTIAYQTFANVSLSGNLLAVGVSQDSSAASGIDGDAEDNSLMSAGSVQLYQRTGSVWAPISYIKPTNPGHTDLFGGSISMADGLLAVGAYQEDSDALGINGDMFNDLALRSGAAYTFKVMAIDDRIFAHGFEN